MMLQGVRQQLKDVYSRLIVTNLSVNQNYPKEQSLEGGGLSIGGLSFGSISLRDISYEDVYKDIERNGNYHIKLPDGGLIVLQYTFDNAGVLTKHRLCYFPSFELPSIDEAPHLYENDELYGDVVARRLVRFPIRFDYDPASHKDVHHPMSHLTFGQYENCRIPVDVAVSPNAFVMFLLRNFYSRAYIRNKNKLDQKPFHIVSHPTISRSERLISHFIVGR
jgi:hypothetical protein